MEAVFINQLKTVENIQDRISALIEEYGSIIGSDKGAVFRTIVDPNGATIYETGKHVDGVRTCDYKFNQSDPNWIDASEEHGLSFSVTTDHAIETMKLLGSFQKKRELKKVTCAYWILENSDEIPDGMQFVPDPDRHGHYFLAVIEPMHIKDLVFNLKWIADHMSAMNDLTLEAWK